MKIPSENIQLFNHKIFISCEVSSNSITLNFDENCRIFIQCEFSSQIDEITKIGHGESPETAVYLFPLLNSKCELARLDEDSILSLQFSNSRILQIIPESNGFESYVVTSGGEIFPVLI